jgi:uncharacterized membrane protein
MKFAIQDYQRDRKLRCDKMQTKSSTGSVSSKYFIAFVIFQSATFFAVGLNIPILRQVLGFFFLSFVPGIVILKALNINNKSFTYIVIFSASVSLASIMFIGLLLNWLLPLVGILTPLGTFNLVIAVIVLEAVLLLAGRLNHSREPLFVRSSLTVSKSLLLIISIPIFSILGAILVSYYANNLIMLFSFVMISVVFLLATLGKIPERLFPLVIFSIAAGILFQTTLSNHFLNGWDVHIEYYVAQVTQSNQFWNYSSMSTLSLSVNNYNTMLSITILPTIYSNILNLNISYVYTVVYPLLFSLVPVALFLMFEKQVGSRFAFWSAFLFISFVGFYEMAYLTRQMVAEMFLVLIFFSLFESETNRYSKSIAALLAILTFGIIVSHYSTAYMCIFYLLFFTLGLIRQSKASLRIAYLSFFVAFAFSWYFFVANSTPIKSIIGFIVAVWGSLQDLFVLEPSNQVISFAAGTFSTTSLVSTVSRLVFILLNVIIAIGVVKTFFARKDVNFSKGFLAVSSGSALLILAAVLVPNLAKGLETFRTYQFGLFFAAPFLVIGGAFVFRIGLRFTGSIPKIRGTTLSPTSVKLGSILISALLIIFFLFQSGVISNLAGGVPSNLSLTIDKGQFVKMGNISPFNAFAFAGDVYGAKWVSNHLNPGTRVYSDSVSALQVLVSYGRIFPGNIFVPSNQTVIPEKSLIFLRDLNVQYGVFMDFDSAYNMTDYSRILENPDLVYSNGQAQVFCVP